MVQNLTDHKIGPAILLKVMSGDKFDVTATSWYKTNGSSASSPNGAGTSLLEALTNGVANLSNGKITAGQLTGAGVFVSGISSFLTSQGSTGGKPKAYLNWILFDEQFNYVSANSGFDIVGADNSAAPYTHTRTNMPVTKNGFLYIYTSNETPNIDVFFDNLQVTHTRGQVLEETHYYPFGLTMAGISSKAAGNMKNKEKTFQGQRFDDDLDLNWAQFKWRNHDVQTGRFIEIDPLSEKYDYNSTYAFSENKVIGHRELEGLESMESIKGDIFRSGGFTTTITTKIVEDTKKGVIVAGEVSGTILKYGGLAVAMTVGAPITLAITIPAAGLTIAKDIALQIQPDNKKIQDMPTSVPGAAGAMIDKTKEAVTGKKSDGFFQALFELGEAAMNLKSPLKQTSSPNATLKKVDNVNSVVEVVKKAVELKEIIE